MATCLVVPGQTKAVKAFAESQSLLWTRLNWDLLATVVVASIVVLGRTVLFYRVGAAADSHSSFAPYPPFGGDQSESISEP